MPEAHNNSPCPVCGYLVFSGPPGTYEMCEVCGWEDDPIQVRHPRMRGGANGGSIWDYQQDLAEELPGIDMPRDLHWRPLREDEARLPGGNVGAVDYGLDYYQGAAPYYWRRSQDGE